MSSPDIERITAFKNVCPYLTESQQQELAAALEIDSPDLTRRLEGLRNEDELALVLNFLGCCKHIMPFDEGVAQLTETACPDLLVQLHDGDTFLVEVKSSEKDLLKIGKGNLERRIQVARDLRLPLYFALKQRGTWGLFSADHVLAQSGKLRLVQDFTVSDFGPKFGARWYVLPAGLEFRCLYQQGGSGLVQNATHGPLVRFEIHFRGECLLRASHTEPDVFLALLLGGVTSQTRRHGPKEGRRRGSFTRIVRSLPFNLTLADYHLYLHLVQSTTRETGALYDRTSYLKSLQDGNGTVTVDVVRQAFERLSAAGVPVLRLDDRASANGQAEGASE